MYILGINLGHNSSAALLKDGKIVGCIEEERFSRKKAHAGFPNSSIKYLLTSQNISEIDLDYVIIDGGYNYPKIPDHYFPKFFEDQYKQKSKTKKILSYLAYKFPNTKNKWINFKWNILYSKDKKRKRKLLRENLAKKMGIDVNKIKIIPHTKAHAYSTCFNNKRNEKTLIFTLDGESEEALCATVNIFDGRDVKTISKSSKTASLGYLYSYATLFLGMRPGQHEFKVMGLAPYAKTDKVNELYDSVFKEVVEIKDNLEIVSKFDLVHSDYFFKEKVKYERFDTIAGAVQKLLEEKICEWVEKSIQKTGINNVAVSGGVFLNVKANMKIAQLESVKNIFIMPSSGDESTCIGDCYYGYNLYCKKNNLEFNPKPLKDLYLGPEYFDEDIEKEIIEQKLRDKFKIDVFKDINLEIAKLLAKGEIVARCSGRSEWGARALGNRSILANPNHKDTIKILNETIKDRDFWMPFTPSIIDKYEKRYLKNPKNIFAPYMCITFESNEENVKKELIAAAHPYDLTIRPQIVKKDYNEQYYDLIEKFQRLSKTGGLLNTSFNLHGEPNVLTPKDAIRTLEKSGLKYLAMNNYLFQKKE